MIDSLSIAVYAFVSRVSMSFSVDETLLPRYVNLSTSFKKVPSSVERREIDKQSNPKVMNLFSKKVDVSKE